MIDGRRANRRRHEGIPGNDRRGLGANAGAWPIEPCDAALFRGITSEVAALNRGAIARVKAHGKIWKLHTLESIAGGDGLRRRRSGSRSSDLLDEVVAEVANGGRTLFLVGRSHGVGTDTGNTSDWKTKRHRL